MLLSFGLFSGVLYLLFGVFFLAGGGGFTSFSGFVVVVVVVAVVVAVVVVAVVVVVVGFLRNCYEVLDREIRSGKWKKKVDG